MIIAEITPEDVLIGCRRTLGLSATPEDIIDDVLLAALSRHCAGVSCPCSRATLRRSILESLEYLSEDKTALSDRIDTVIEGVIVSGDLLELSEVATDDPAVKGTWVFAAPPSFVVRSGGSIFLTGIVPDQSTFLPPSLASRITYEGLSRVIVPEVHEDVRGQLRDQGLQELSESVWLKSPKPETAESMLNEVQRRLSMQPPSGTIDNLQILDSARRVTYYAGRWIGPQRHSGTFIAKRPQDYGAPIWCFVALEAGTPIRLLDLPIKKTRWRGCDVAWYLQMAIDSCRHAPQMYRRRTVDNGVRLDFFSPLPQWAQRRLMVFGRPVPRESSLFSYRLPVSEADTEERFLQERLWLRRTQDSN